MGHKCIRDKYRFSFQLRYSILILVAFWSCIQFYFITEQEKIKGKNIYKKRFEELTNKLYLSVLTNKLYLSVQNHIWQWKYRSCLKQKALETTKIDFIAIKTKLNDLILSCKSASLCTSWGFYFLVN